MHAIAAAITRSSKFAQLLRCPCLCQLALQLHLAASSAAYSSQPAESDVRRQPRGRNATQLQAALDAAISSGAASFTIPGGSYPEC